MAEPLAATVRNHLAGLRMLLVFTVVTGVLYPLAVTGVAQAAFHDQAEGSQVEQDGRIVGSSLLGQDFDLPRNDPGGPGEAAKPDPEWFQPRPSSGGYDPLATGASNLGPNNEDLVASIEERRRAVAAFDGVSPGRVPVDAVTASGSGLDPHISRAYAEQQVDRVAGTRGLDRAKVAKLVADRVQGRVLGFLGEERVNVVELNRDLAELGQR